MTQLLEIKEIRKLDEFRDLIRPIAKVDHDRIAGLPSEPGKIRINLDSEAMVSAATDEFVKLLPKEYVKQSLAELSKAVPEDIVEETIRRMTTIVMK